MIAQYLPKKHHRIENKNKTIKDRKTEKSPDRGISDRKVWPLAKFFGFSTPSTVSLYILVSQAIGSNKISAILGVLIYVYGVIAIWASIFFLNALVSLGFRKPH